MATLLQNSFTRIRTMGTKHQDQILLPNTEIVGAVKYLMGIANPFRTDTVNRTDPTIQPTIIQFYQSTVLGHSDRNQYLLGSFYIGTGVTRSERNIDNCTGMNPKGTFVTKILESNRADNCDIFDLVKRPSDLAYRRSAWKGIMKSGSEKL